MSGDVSVKEILPMMSDGFPPHVTEGGHPLASARRSIRQYIRGADCVSGQGFLDAACGMGRNHADTSDAALAQVTARRQDAGPARGRGLAPAPRGGPRRGLSEPPVLRPTRPRPGQVRDGASPPDRGAPGDRGRRALRCQPAGVLRGGGRLRGPRDPRVGAQTPRTEAGPQVHRRGGRLRRTLAGGRRRATGRVADGGRGAAVWNLDSCPLARPGGCPSQKKPRP